MEICTTCHGTRHVRQKGRWVRCACITRSLSTSFVHPTLRAGDTDAPDITRQFPRHGTIAEGGNWDYFRHSAWQTLLLFEPEGITHDVVFFHRLADIKTGAEQQEDTQEITLRDLVGLDVLVLIISAYDISNKLTRSVLGNLLDERTNRAKATWIFTHLTGYPLRNLLDDAIARRWFPHLTDAHATAPSVSPAPRSDGPGAGPRVEPPHPAGGGTTRRY